MSSYIQIEFENMQAEQSDLLIAQLSLIGFEGFEETDTILKAFIPANDFDEIAINEIASRNNVSFKQSTIEETNWNAVWESNFQPVMVDDFVSIRADFHEAAKGVEHEIVITPKMSFGTGHHATTYMMIQQMREIDFNDKTVFDFGTGTGVLAILAEKLGARTIYAVDNDEWSILNTKENIERNNSRNIKVEKIDVVTGAEQFNIILANINRNIILDNFLSLKKMLAPSGTLLLSGLLEEDEKVIVNKASEHLLTLNKKIVYNNWISLRFSH
ncbi:50S ribosomal protein L11 methyltransferase [Chitinophagaceae bacterium IBVUCB2]|nr:50S ribosomal protein L11 methyltransferase [Chitinophagaceae bacterium IBVUCB2]